MAAKRVKRLKDLVGLLERLPASPDRDRVLSEVRSRAVDLDTGVTPRAMHPVREPAPLPVLPRAPKRDTARIAPAAPPPPAPALGLAHSAFATGPWKGPDQKRCVGERLSLEDSPPRHARAQGDRAVPPWTRSLRA
jgi:hypothetical protein